MGAVHARIVQDDGEADFLTDFCDAIGDATDDDL